MVSVEKVNLNSKKEIDAFIQLQYDLYRDTPQFCPPFRNDIKLMMDKKKHPFYEFSDGDFFVAKRDGTVVGRLGVMVNNPFNEYHQVKKGQFYLFDSIDDREVAEKLFGAAFTWCRERGLNEIVGPKGLSAFDGYGILVEGFEHRQMMTMMNYNFEYYPRLLESLGFEKEVDFISCYLHRDAFSLPEKIQEVARRVLAKGKFKVLSFNSKRQMIRDWADKIGIAYNKTFVNNWEYYPLSQREIDMLVKNLMEVIEPKLIKIITYEDNIVGFLLAFPDITSALQRHGGKITPFALLDILRSFKKTNWVSLNGAGVLPEYHGSGGNALLYAEMDKTIKTYGFEHFELTQVAETAQQMRKDLITAGGKPYKNHRVYHRKI